MKNTLSMLLLTLCLAACKSTSHDGTYVTHAEDEYSILDDTIIMTKNTINKKAGYHKIIDGKVMPKAWKTKTWYLNGLGAPVIQFGKGEITIGTLTYQKVK